MKNIKLHPYQQEAKNFILTRPSCALWLDMGLGKTLITLDALYTINPNGHVLLIAPKNIAKSVWQDEIDKWEYPIRTQSLIIDEKGKKLSKKAYLELFAKIPSMPPTLFFINREMVTKLIDNAPIIDNQKIWCFPIVIIDEAQSFKSYKSARFKAFKKIRHAIKHVIQLSGTPTPKGLMDLWSQIWLLDQGQRLGKNITEYRTKYFNEDRYINNYAISWKAKPGAEEAIHAAVKDIAISIENTNLNLPPMTFNDIIIHLSETEKKLYKELKQEKILEAMNDEIKAANAGVLHGRLSQMASGSLYIDDNKNFIVIHEQKLELCKYIIENSKSNILIAYHFKSELKMLLDYFKDTDIDLHVFDGSKKMKDAWNNKELRVLIIHPASSGHGLNIQYGGSHLIWYNLPDSLEEYLQTVKRLHRQGQTEPVIITRLLTKGTIDEKKVNNLAMKKWTQDTLLNAVNWTLKEGL